MKNVAVALCVLALVGCAFAYNTRIQARRSDNDFFYGYINNGGWSFVANGIDDVNVNTVFSFTDVDTDGITLTIVSNNLAGNFPVLAMNRGNQAVTEFGPGKAGYAWMQASTPVPAGQTWTNTPSGHSQTAVFRIDSVTKELTAKIIQPDGSAYPVKFIYNVATSGWYMVGDLAGFNSVYNEQNELIRLYVEYVGPGPVLNCNQFDLSKYGGQQPVITSSASGSTVTINVAMLRQTLDNTVTPVFHDIDTKPATSNVCHTAANNIQNSAGVAWTKATTSCSDTYTITQDLSDITTSTSNNNWVATLIDDGRTIKYTLTLYATYSINNNGECYYVGFKSYISFQTKLAIASSSSTFTTADKSAKFSFSGLRVTPANVLEIAGTMTPLVPSSTLKNFALKKTSNSLAFSTTAGDCSDTTNGCAQTYTISVPVIQAGGNDISGQYDTTMDLYENGVVTRPGVTLSYTLSYTIPTDPAVVDSDTITTGSTLYTSNAYTTPRVASYQSNSATPLFIENKIISGPAIPTSYRLTMTEGYICCYAYGTSITAYNAATGLGGCKDPAGKLEQSSLGNAATHPLVQLYTPADAENAKRYRLEVLLSSVFQTTSHNNPMTCEVLLISKLEDSARRIQGSSSGATPYSQTFVSTTPLLIESQKVVSSAAVSSVALSVIAVAAVLLL